MEYSLKLRGSADSGYYRWDAPEPWTTSSGNSLPPWCGNFNPRDKATRAETAVLMYRAMETYGLLYLDKSAPELPCLTCPYSR